MRKNTDVVSGLVSEEHPFHQAQTQPGKAKQHRYERRKVRGILKVGDWGEEIEYEEDKLTRGEAVFSPHRRGINWRGAR